MKHSPRRARSLRRRRRFWAGYPFAVLVTTALLLWWNLAADGLSLVSAAGLAALVLVALWTPTWEEQ